MRGRVLRLAPKRDSSSAERLWDVNPATGTETLVARGTYRLDPNRPNGLQVF